MNSIVPKLEAVIGIGVCLLACSQVFADPPASSYVFPVGGQRGTTVQCRVSGLNLSAECGFRMIGSGIESPAKISAMPTLVLVGPYHHNPIAQQAWDYPRDMAASLKLAADAPLGVRYWYCTTAEGATQLRPFVVGDLPEAIEDEEKTKPGNPQPVTLPVTINGRIYPRADLDEFTFEAKAGEHLSCEVMAQRLGHKLDGKLELRDAAGRIIAESDDGFGRDPLLLATIPADGRYVLRINDIAFEGDQDYVYRLTIRTGPFVTHVFPAGGQRGKTVPARLYGSGLGPDGFAEQTLNLGSDLLAGSSLASGRSGIRSVPGSTMAMLMSPPASPPTSSATGANSATGGGATASGVFPSPWQVSAAFQISDLAEVVETEPNEGTDHAQRVAFPAVLNGQLATPGDSDEFVFAAKKGESWDIDLFGRRLGSPITAVWTLFDAQAKQLARQEGDTRFTFVAPADGDYTLRVHELHRETHGGSEFIYRIVVARPQPDFRLTLERDAIGVPPGQAAKMKLNAIRTGGFAGEIQLAASDMPPGITLAPSTIAANQNQLELSFTAATDAAIGDTRRALVIGAAMIDGQRVLHTAEVPIATGTSIPPTIDSLAVTVTHPPLFSIDTEEVFANANRGATHVQRFRIDRQPGFDGEIALSLADRQIRYLQGVVGPTVIVKLGQKVVDYPVFFPDVMDLNRTARMLLVGTAKVTDAAGKVHYVTSTTKKQIAVRVSPSILTLTTDALLLEAKPGQTIAVPFRVGRAPELTGPVTVEAVLPGDMKGITASTRTVSHGQDDAKLTLQLASDAQLGHHDQIRFRATAERGGLPVIAEVAVEIQLEQK